MPLLLVNLHLSVIKLSYLTIEPFLHLGIAWLIRVYQISLIFADLIEGFDFLPAIQLGLVGFTISFCASFFPFVIYTLMATN